MRMQAVLVIIGTDLLNSRLICDLRSCLSRTARRRIADSGAYLERASYATSQRKCTVPDALLPYDVVLFGVVVHGVGV